MKLLYFFAFSLGILPIYLAMDFWSEEDCNNGFLTVENYCLEGFVFKTIKPCGRRMCVEECKHNEICESINFIRSEMECQINLNKTLTSHNLIYSLDCTYVEMNETTQTTCISPCDNITCSYKELCTELHDGTAKCVIARCDAELFENNTTYITPDYSVGAIFNVSCQDLGPCAVRSDDYMCVNVGVITHACMADGIWKRVGNYCTKLVYKIHEALTTSSYDAIRNSCFADGGDLVIVDTEEKSQILVSAIETHDQTAGSYTFYAIGMKLDAGVFRWKDGQDLVYQNWAPGQPEMNGGCVAYRKDTLQWHDISCTNSHNFICQKPT